MNHILITGATGTLGSQLVPLFSRDPDTSVYLLIRAGSEAELQERFKKLLAYLHIERTENIVPVRGDVSAPHLGMEPEFYRQMSAQCIHIIHAAASIKLNMSPEEAERSTLAPCRSIIEFIEICQKNGQFKKLGYVSTIGVAGKTQGLIEECRLNEVQDFHNNYERYKSKCESLLFEKMDDGLPVTIHRPSMIVGDSRNGSIIHFQGFYMLMQFFAGLFTFGFVPILPKLTIDTVPVDYVAAGIHWSTLDIAATGKILHYTSAGESLPVNAFILLVRKTYAGEGIPLPKLKQINVVLFITVVRFIRLFCFGKTRWLLDNLFLFLEYIKNEQLFDNRKTKKLLSEHGINLPDPPDYLPAVIGYFLHSAKE